MGKFKLSESIYNMRETGLKNQSKFCEKDTVLWPEIVHSSQPTFSYERKVDLLMITGTHWAPQTISTQSSNWPRTSKVVKLRWRKNNRRDKCGGNGSKRRNTETVQGSARNLTNLKWKFAQRIESTNRGTDSDSQ